VIITSVAWFDVISHAFADQPRNP